MRLFATRLSAVEKKPRLRRMTRRSSAERASLFHSAMSRAIGASGAGLAGIVRGLEALLPREHVHVVQPTSARRVEIEIERLAHVDPLLTTRRALDQPLGLDLERREVFLPQRRRHAVDVAEGAV